MDEEQRRLAQKSQFRTDRRVKELTFSQEEDSKKHERNKVKCYKKQIEEAEEIVALNLATFRKVQSDLEQAEERADINEQVLAKYKPNAVALHWDQFKTQFTLQSHLRIYYRIKY